MTLSIWRYSHLLLAISSCLFLFVASVTGVILAIEPISDTIHANSVKQGKNISLAKTIESLQQNYDEIFTIEINENQGVIVSAIDNEGNDQKVFVDPFTGNQLGAVPERAKIFKFSTNLHRSLFLKSTGRFLIGFVSFLLFLITITGIILILKRQKGFLHFFKKIEKNHFTQYYHIILGKWFFLPIMIITITGVYLSLEKFSLLPEGKITHDLHFEDHIQSKKLECVTFSIFRNITLGEVRSLEFPFSDDIEDYFLLKLTDKELVINQFTGEVISEQKYPFVVLASYWSLVLHTGKGNIAWSIILLLTSASLLFFMFSGFSMAIGRSKKSKPANFFSSKDEAEYIILVGSETGTTFQFANIFGKALYDSGQKVFLSELNAYSSYKKANHLIIFAATYGDGEPTTNARKFEELSKKVNPNREMLFSVVGFGSLQYPKFCHFAVKVNVLLQGFQFFRPVLPLYKINNQSFEAFQDWVSRWSAQVSIPLVIEADLKRVKSSKIKSFKVKERSTLNEDATFLITLKVKIGVNFESGDLLAIRPEEDMVERLYSIAKIGKDILLSVKKHELGVCSSFLSKLSTGDTFKAAIKKNPDFHFPNAPSFFNRTSKKSVILIANGTGIAPFLGMLDQNKKCIATHLFWGGRTSKSFDTYKDMVEDACTRNQLSSYSVAYSREKKKEYVQDLILKRADLIAIELELGSVIMICGSLAMQRSVLAVLEEISSNKLNRPLDYFEKRKQIKTDCY